MKTNWSMKKDDDKVAGLYKVLKVYLRACLIELPANIKNFPIFHNSLLRPHSEARGLLGQHTINTVESQHLRSCILEKEDGSEEIVEKWEFDKLLNSYRDYEDIQYFVRWKDHAAT
ncbi:hypothetical protein GQ43DRAFT_338270, partial [Delitschia confertaspora ATCC 74209]